MLGEVAAGGQQGGLVEQQALALAFPSYTVYVAHNLPPQLLAQKNCLLSERLARILHLAFR